MLIKIRKSSVQFYITSITSRLSVANEMQIFHAIHAARMTLMLRVIYGCFDPNNFLLFVSELSVCVCAAYSGIDIYLWTYTEKSVSISHISHYRAWAIEHIYRPIEFLLHTYIYIYCTNTRVCEAVFPFH